MPPAAFTVPVYSHGQGLVVVEKFPPTFFTASAIRWLILVSDWKKEG